MMRFENQPMPSTPMNSTHLKGPTAIVIIRAGLAAMNRVTIPVTATPNAI